MRGAKPYKVNTKLRLGGLILSQKNLRCELMNGVARTTWFTLILICADNLVLEDFTSSNKLGHADFA